MKNLPHRHVLICCLLWLPASFCFLSSPNNKVSTKAAAGWSLLHAKANSVIAPEVTITRHQRYVQGLVRNATLADAAMIQPSHKVRNRRHRVAGGDGATSDRVCFHKPKQHQQASEDEELIDLKASRKKKVAPKTKQSLQWFVVSNDTILCLDTTQPTGENKQEIESPRTVAESAFLGKCILPMETRQSAVELATLLDIPLRSAETMIRKVPSLATTDLLGKIAGRCVEMSILLRIAPREFASVVKRFPNLLTLKPKKLEKKLMQLDTLLACSSNSCLVDNVWDVSERTLATVKRVPRLLAYDVPGTLTHHVHELSTLLAVEDNATMKKILRRCPELLMYRVTQNLLPKLLSLHTVFEVATLDVVKKEPRLLLYSVEDSLLPKVQIWKDRVEDSAKFHQLLCRYPSLLLYSRGASARLEYYTHVNGRKPDSTDARQLLMTSKKVVETWGQDLAANKPSFLSGSISKRGRPRRGETVKEAASRRWRRNKISDSSSQPALSYRQWLESSLVGDLSDVQLCVAELGNLERQFGVVASK
jgi:hypothetical protein